MNPSDGRGIAFGQPDSSYQSGYVANPDGVVPAVPSYGAASAWGSAQSPSLGAWGQGGGAWGAPPSAAAGTVPQVMPVVSPLGTQQPQLAFTDSTAAPSVSGNIGSSPGQNGGRLNNQAGPSAPEKDTKPLLKPAEDPTKYPFYNIRKYRPYFDVDTKEVLWRVINSLFGVFRPNFMEKTMESPDLYGPFWVATTLIFVTAVAGNYSSWIAWHFDQKQDGALQPPPPAGTPAAPPGSESAGGGEWFADYTKLSASAGIFYGYVFIIGLCLWGAIKWLRGDMKLINIYCIYGYSLTIFIPVSLICVIPFSYVRWPVVIVATLLSVGFLIMNIRQTVMEAGAGTGKSLPVLLLVLLLHIGLGLALLLYFFSY